MSGTSLDGMDAALVRFDGPTRATLLAFVTRPYDAAERGRIEHAITGGRAPELARLHAQLGHWAVEAVQAVLDAGKVRSSDLDLIAFHGQTIWHEPPAVTWQLGEPAFLAEQFQAQMMEPGSEPKMWLPFCRLTHTPPPTRRRPPALGPGCGP